MLRILYPTYSPFATSDIVYHPSLLRHLRDCCASRLEKKGIMSTNLQRLRNLSFSINLATRNVVCLNKRLLHEGPDTLEELLDRHVVKKEKSLDDEEEELMNRRRLTSTRREALSLYRDILRATRFFMWPDSQGMLWRDVLRANARKEFEEARFERDPEIVTRLLIDGRDALQSAVDKLAEKHRQQIEKERGGVGGSSGRDRG